MQKVVAAMPFVRVQDTDQTWRQRRYAIKLKSACACGFASRPQYWPQTAAAGKPVLSGLFWFRERVHNISQDAQRAHQLLRASQIDGARLLKRNRGSCCTSKINRPQCQTQFFDGLF
jgi:hypothetical protein